MRYERTLRMKNNMTDEDFFGYLRDTYDATEIVDMLLDYDLADDDEILAALEELIMKLKVIKQEEWSEI